MTLNKFSKAWNGIKVKTVLQKSGAKPMSDLEEVQWVVVGGGGGQSNPC